MFSSLYLAMLYCLTLARNLSWEAADALRRRLASSGLVLDGAPGGWTEVVDTFRSCKFVEDDGDVVFYKNAYGQAACKPVFPGGSISDSGVEVDNDA